MSIRVVVGIVTYNSADHWPACYAALQAQTVLPAPLEIRVYDNASTDETVAEIRRAAPHLSLTCSRINRGYGAAHNALIAAAHLQPDDFYLALNPDAILAPDYIAQLAAVLQNDSRGGWATGRLFLSPDDKQLYSRGHALRRDGFAINIGHGLSALTHNAPAEVFGAPGAAVLIKAALLHDLGTPFDETFFVYLEDVDFDWRARRRGWRCWSVPAACARHDGSQAHAEGQARTVVNRWLMILKNASMFDLLLYHPPRWITHVLLRGLVTPRWALWMLRRFVRLAPLAWRARRADPPRWREPEIAAWFAWARTQPTSQPYRLVERWRALRQK